MGPFSRGSDPLICLHSSAQDRLIWVPEGNWEALPVGSSSPVQCAELGKDRPESAFPRPKYGTQTAPLPAEPGGSSQSTGQGSCKLLLLDVLTYLPNHLPKVFQETYPCQSLLDSPFTQLVPTAAPAAGWEVAPTPPSARASPPGLPGSSAIPTD